LPRQFNHNQRHAVETGCRFFNNSRDLSLKEGKTMLWFTKDLCGYFTYTINGGKLGRVHTFYFNSRTWTIYNVAIDLGERVLDSGEWIPGRKVIVPATMLGQPSQTDNLLPLRLTMEQLERCPDMETPVPDFNQRGVLALDRFRPTGYGNGIMALDVSTIGLHSPPVMESPTPSRDKQMAWAEAGRHNNPYHFSTEDVIGYHIQALDGEMGHVEDFLIDLQTWGIDSMIVDTRNWLPGKKVMVALQWVDVIASDESKVYVDLPCDIIKNSPRVNLAALAT
jgi:sporulation protein YlmC with PRC-barrel domain